MTAFLSLKRSLISKVSEDKQGKSCALVGVKKSTAFLALQGKILQIEFSKDADAERRLIKCSLTPNKPF